MIPSKLRLLFILIAPAVGVCLSRAQLSPSRLPTAAEIAQNDKNHDGKLDAAILWKKRP